MSISTNKNYGFQAHLSFEFPSQILVDVTEVCNLACIHCPHEEFTKSGIYNKRYLDPKLNKKLVDEVFTDSINQCKYIRYAASGEPLLHPNFVEMIDYACKNSGVPVNVTTNGVLLNEAKARILLDIGVDVVDISIDAYSPGTYSDIRKGGKLKVTKSNVLRLIKLAREGKYKTKIVASFVEQPLNKSERNDFKRFWEDAGADFVVIRAFHSCAGSKEDVADFMKKQKQNRKPCLYPWERLVLNPTGEMGFCPGDWKSEDTIIDFRKASIKEIWQGEFMNKLREAHLKNDFRNYIFCDQCPDWSVAKWPESGRAYSVMMQELAD